MKRVTILVDDIGETDEDGERALVGVRPSWPSWPHPALAYVLAYVAADRILSVEDYIEPLPTEPGTRFWGRLNDDEPQWWFARDVNGLVYLGARGGAYAPEAEPLERPHTLTRLPDPKPTETPGDAR